MASVKQDEYGSMAATGGLLVAAGLLVMAVMAVLPLLNVHLAWMRWFFATGAVLSLAGRIMGLYKGDAIRVKRLHRLLVSSSLLYCASALMMFLSVGTNDWVGFLLAGLVMQLYASWMIDHEAKKDKK